MGVDVRLENRRGQIIGEVADPKGYVNWLISLAEREQTACLRFIDQHGITVFNLAQIAALREEFDALRPRVTNQRLRASKEEYLQSTSNWPTKARMDAAQYVASLSADDLIEHLAKLLALVVEAVSQGPHHYLRFVGD
jgi:hypothetical protein